MPYLFCYDIENDTKRLKTAAKLIELGFQRVQKSVFAGDPGEYALRSLQDWLKRQFHQGTINRD
ncbi:MAG: CRISPR-associated endonuclease Cas2, partial [Saprospiraceae bacterium]|nr:CRISPR-associated endonuclease Cas2 [Saprospiraceae bacterium]